MKPVTTTTPATTQYLELPHDLEAEQATLGSVLLNRDVLPAIRGLVAPDAFYLQKHADLYGAMLRLLDQRIPPDTLTIAQALGREGLDRIGGIEYLGALATGTPNAYHAEYYARRVHACAVLRGVIEAGGRIAALGHQAYLAPEADGAGPEQVLADAQHLLTRVQERACIGRTFLSMLDVADRLYQQQTAVDPPWRAPTGFHDLDGIFGGGFARGTVNVVAGRPGTGKTALALNLATAAARVGRVAFFSLEMSSEELGSRLLAQATGIDTYRLRNRLVQAEELIAINTGLGQIAGYPIWIDDQLGMTADELCLRATILANADPEPLALVVIDYLGLLEYTIQRGENDAAAIGRMSRRMKRLAKDLDVPVLLLHQLSRAVESRSDHVPTMADLRGSGEIEQHADSILFLYREELYDKETDKKGITEIHIAKHRNGPVGVVPLRWDAPTTTFHDVTFRTPEGY